jgi:RNA polymerase sigma-54 factor
MAGCSVRDAETVLAAVQVFDPVGVAARTPQECLMVQLRMLGYDRDPVLTSLVTEHLEDLEARRYKPLLRKFRLDMEDLREYLDIIQSLDPMPGASYGGGEPAYVSPDVYVFKHDGEFVILLNEDGLPQLQISTLYDNAAGATDQEKEYFLEKQRAASWLIRSLFQRQRTLRKVVESIVKYQREFFEEGVSKLKPLILKDIADDISMHESTVSRITTNKYVATAHGVYELKFFFNSALELDDGSQVGSESVKALIRKCVSEEDPHEPLSDERIGELLKEHLAVRIARRTVAKYRMAMDIPSSSHRRAHF